MYVKFNTLKFRNINSYGNQITTFDFKQGLNLIAGANGQGKSTVIDALCFCLFGYPFRKVKIKDLINRTNKKKMWTNVCFTIGKHTFEITRSLKPDKLQIKKNGEPLDLLSTKRLTQEEIDKILGLDITLFRQIISLAINYSKPFLSLYSNEKRDIIETIFNVKVFGLMYRTLKLTHSGLKSEWEINRRTIHLLEEHIKQTNRQIKELEDTRNNFEKNKTSEKNALDKQIIKLTKEIEKHKKNVSTLKDKSKRLSQKISDVTSEMKEQVVKNIGQSDGTIKRASKDLKFFEENDVCHVCSSDITDTKKQYIKELKTRIQDAEKKKTTLTNKKNRIEKQLELKRKRTETINQCENDVIHENEKIKFYDTQIKKYKETLTEVEKKEFNFDIDKMKEDFKEKKKEYRETFNSTSSMQKDLTINEIIFNILGDEGIKSHFFAKLIPILNTKVNEYLAKFDIPITLMFNEFMEEKISTFGQFTGLPYQSFSEGEKKRIDIAILLSFIETTKIISNWSTNILFFDELLDTSTDEEGMYRIMDSIKSLILKDKNLCIYVVTHRTSDYYFDNIYNVSQAAGFSKIS